MVLGDLGVGKTWFCIRAIFQLLEQSPEAEVLYCDFGGNFRIKNLKKLLSNSCELDQITIFHPKSLLEQIVFFRNLLETSKSSYDLIILDSVFGSPLTSQEYFQKKAKFWEKPIFSHLLDLQHIAREFKIPLLLTNHLFPAKENSDMNSSLAQYGGNLIEQFVPFKFLIQKTEQKNSLEVRVFQKMVGTADFVSVPISSKDN
jgi:RecA/RadA recombinase